MQITATVPENERDANIVRCAKIRGMTVTALLRELLDAIIDDHSCSRSWTMTASTRSTGAMSASSESRAWSRCETIGQAARDVRPVTSIEQTGHLESALDADFVRILRQLRRELNGVRAQHALADDMVAEAEAFPAARTVRTAHWRDRHWSQRKGRA
jgi:hypothetical protein